MNHNSEMLSRRELRKQENLSKQPRLWQRAVSFRTVNKRSLLTRVGAATVLLFVAGMVVATSLPASVFSSPTGSNAALAQSVSSADSSQVYGDPQNFEEQQVTASSQPTAGVSRDGYGVSTVKPLSSAGTGAALTFTNNPRGSIQWPFAVGVRISDGFGERVAPCSGCSTDHKGLDFDPGSGAPIQIIADGVVRSVQSTDNGGLGINVVIDHVINGEKVTSVYAHMIPGSVAVTAGQKVTVGQIVGLVGSSGAATGAHLHFELHRNDVPVDPFSWLTAHAN